MRRLLGSTALLLALTVGQPPPALAYEDQLTLGLGAGHAFGVVQSLLSHGLAVDLNGGVGLDAVWSARARVSYALHRDPSLLHIVAVSPELLYSIDVVQVVPYFGLGLSGLARVSGGKLHPEIGAHPVLGLDYLASRTVAFGLDVRPEVILTELESHPLELLVTLNASWFFDQ